MSEEVYVVSREIHKPFRGRKKGAAVCLTCGRKSRIVRTSWVNKGVERVRRCRCGTQFTTFERIVKIEKWIPLPKPGRPRKGDVIAPKRGPKTKEMDII